jgi:hypothetical protein
MPGPGLNVKVVKYPAFMRGTILEQPEVEHSIDTISDRLERRGKGLGERRNHMNTQRMKLGRRYEIGISHYPRRTGWAKKAYMRKVFVSMVPRVINKLIERISARWEA